MMSVIITYNFDLHLSLACKIVTVSFKLLGSRLDDRVISDNFHERVR